MTIDPDSLRDLILHDQDFDLDEGGGGAGAATLYKFDIAHDTAGLNDGVTVYTPTAGQWMLDAWLHVTEDFNGTTPKWDFGTGATGWAADMFGAEFYPFGHLADVNYGGMGSANYARSMSAVSIEYAIVNTPDNSYPWVAKFLNTDPLKLWVSQDGLKGGTAVGGTEGQATFYLLVASPVSLNT